MSIQIIPVFFAVIFSVALFSILRPDLIVKCTIFWLKLHMKMMGLEADIRATPRAFEIIRCWNILMLLFVSFLFVMELQVFQCFKPVSAPRQTAAPR